MVSPNAMKALLGVLAPLVASNCATQASEAGIVQDVEFLRGCWIERNDQDRAVATLRLLPPSPDADVLVGEMLLYPDTPKPYVLEDRISLTFARDGSRLERTSVTNPPSRTDRGHFVAQPLPQGESSAGAQAALRKWTSVTTPAIGYEVEAEGERLRLFYLIPSHDVILKFIEFDGERDGCD